MHKALMYHGGAGRALLRSQTDVYSEARKKGEVVHSGHFMISSVADDLEEVEDIDHNRDSPIHHEQSMMIKYGGYDFSNVPKETKDTYQFGPLPSNQITIDASLARLFRCMSLAYQGGKVVSPKWKNFKGMKLTVKDKIRLNNAIWRTWHIQYVIRKKKQASLIQFATPLDLDYNSHARPESIVLEGKYWKRRIETVVAEYKKWRAFFMEKLKLSDYPGLMWVTENNASPSKDTNDIERMRMHDEIPHSDFTDSLFSNLSQQPFHFPNPREIAMHATNSDMMQPGLLQLQPSMDDMEFDPFQEFFSPPKKQIVSFTGAPSQPTNDIFQIGDLTQVTEESNLINQQQSSVTIMPALQAPNTQASMDFVDTFADVARQDNMPMLQEPVSADDSIFSSVGANSAFYPPNNTERMQHLAPQPNRIHHSNATISNSIPPPAHFQQPDPKRYHAGQLLQQNVSTTVSSSIDSTTFVPIQNNMSTLINGSTVQQQQQPRYPHSKHVVNTPANKITYSHTQTSQMMEIFPRNHHHQRHPQQTQTHQPPALIPVAVEANNRTTVLPTDRMHPTHAATPSMPEQASRPNHRQPEYNNVQVVMTQQNQQQPPNNVFVTSAADRSSLADAILLKKLLANRGQTTLPPVVPQPQTQVQVHHRKRNSTFGTTVNRQSQQQNQQFSPISVQEPVKQTHNMAHATSPSLKHVAGPVVEKRKSMDDPVSFFDGKNSDVWPNKRKPSSASSTSTSPVKAIVQDVEMDFTQSFEPVSSLAQDNDFAQMDSRHSLSTEQKRRFNIKIAFTRLHKLLPGCNAQANNKLSKATLLGKTSQYVKSMQSERAKIKDEIEGLKKDLEKLHVAINSTQLELPATGAPAPRPRGEEATKRFQAWTRHRTKQEWKYSLFSMVVEPWFNSYQKSVTLGGTQEFYNSIFLWLEDHCSLRVLRPSVVRSLQVISTTTSILTNPSQLRQQIEASVKDGQEQPGRSSSSVS